MSAGLVPVGGWAVDDGAVGAEVEVVGAAVWVDVVATVVVIRGNEQGATVSGEAKGVRRIARRSESSSGSWVLSELESGGTEGNFGGSRDSGSGVSGCVWVCTSYSDISGRSAPRWGKEFPALWQRVYHAPWWNITGTACLSSTLRPVGWNAWQPYPQWVSDGSNQNIWVFGGASVILGSETNMNSGEDVAWLDDASMNSR